MLGFLSHPYRQPIMYNEISDYFSGISIATNQQHYIRLLIHHNTMNTVRSEGINIHGLLSDPNWTQDRRLHINYNTIIGNNSLTTFDGIKLVDTENAIIGDNHIEHLATMISCDMNAYYGIHLHRALNTWVSSNTIENFCYGLYGRDNLLFTRLECNDFIATRSIYFHEVNIGNIGSPAQTANNRWINNTVSSRILGTLFNTNPTPIYYWNSTQGTDFDPMATIVSPFANATIYSCISAPAYRPLDAAELPAPELQLYPNPFTDGLNIQGSGHARVDLSVYNLHGQLVFQKNQLSLSEQVTLDLRDLPAGIYMLSVHQSGHRNVYKVVKQ